MKEFLKLVEIQLGSFMPVIYFLSMFPIAYCTIKWQENPHY